MKKSINRGEFKYPQLAQLARVVKKHLGNDRQNRVRKVNSPRKIQSILRIKYVYALRRDLLFLVLKGPYDSRSTEIIFYSIQQQIYLFTRVLQ